MKQQITKIISAATVLAITFNQFVFAEQASLETGGATASEVERATHPPGRSRHARRLPGHPLG